MAEHFSWLVEIHFRQPDGKIKGHYTDEIRFENVSAADAEEAGAKIVEIYQGSAERAGLLDIKVVSVEKRQVRVQRRPNRAIFRR